MLKSYCTFVLLLQNLFLYKMCNEFILLIFVCLKSLGNIQIHNNGRWLIDKFIHTLVSLVSVRARTLRKNLFKNPDVEIQHAILHF